LGTEAVLAAVSVAAFSSNFILFGAAPTRRCLDPVTPMSTGCKNIDHSEEDLSRNLLRVQLISGGLFVAVAVAGVIDALRNYQSLVPVPAMPPPAAGGADKAGAPAAAPAAPAATAAGGRRALPVLFPLTQATGLGLAWTF